MIGPHPRIQGEQRDDLIGGLSASLHGSRIGTLSTIDLASAIVSTVEMIVGELAAANPQQHPRYRGGHTRSIETTPEQEAEIIQLLRAVPRLSQKAIADRIGVPPWVVTRTMHAYARANAQ